MMDSVILYACIYVDNNYISAYFKLTLCNMLVHTKFVVLA